MVSVIIPTYKRAEYIERAICSVLNQTYQDFEIIVVDDNNPGTQERLDLEKVMKKYENNSQIIYVQHEKNKNGAAARNTGIGIAKGEYITFLDDDDYFLKNRLEVMVKALDENLQYNAAYSDSIVKKNQYFIELNIANYKGNCEKNFLRASSIIGTGSNIFFRARQLKEINGFNIEFLRHQDYEVLVRFFENGNLMFNVNELLVVKDDSSRINVPDCKKALEYREKYLKYFENNIKKYDDWESIYYKNYLDLLHIAIQVKDKEMYNIIYEKLKKYTKDEKNLNKHIAIYKIKTKLKNIKIIQMINSNNKSKKFIKKVPKEKIEEIFNIENNCYIDIKRREKN